MPRRILLCLAVILAGNSCTNPRVMANMGQAIQDIGSEMSAQRQDMAILQEQIDSLKQAMAKQDSTIKRLLNVTGLPGLSP